ncbi:zealexin A1 synthase-like [Punica granatum]|uniref:Zealexin A1 synthase-like n=1 Tax=Punica granatum TaxID=22663 RepID=A0A6P8DMI3_PUNGR|nr:zealexin A1 synthase-like [Punica granatum]
MDLADPSSETDKEFIQGYGVADHGEVREAEPSRLLSSAQEGGPIGRKTEDDSLQTWELPGETTHTCVCIWTYWDMFAAGTDTTSSTLEWAMAELFRNPEKLLKVQAVLRQVIGRGIPC